MKTLATGEFARIVAVAATVLISVTLLGACNRSDSQTSQRHAPAAPKVSETSPAPPPAAPPAADSQASSPPTAPPAADSQADKSETANANDPPMKPMSPREESASMPQPGQANDHSTVAGDGKK